MKGAYGAADDIVDFILGITFEIWEQRGVELIHQYYGAEAPIYGLAGNIHGAAAVVAGTHQVLASYPDRVLLGENVIWSGNRQEGFYSSHRIVSLMTNTGDTQFGPATGRQIRILSIADCFVEEGVITREWLMRDYHGLITQLGLDLSAAAAVIAKQRSDDTLEWIAAELGRTKSKGTPKSDTALVPAEDTHAFAEQLVASLWTSGEQKTLEAAYAPYAVLHRSAERLYSGRAAINEHYAQLRNAIDVTGVTVDHVAVQPFSSNGLDIAVRWAVAGRHAGEFIGHAATGKPVFVMGVSHWRVIAGRIVCEWTVFDGLGVLAQLL